MNFKFRILSLLLFCITYCNIALCQSNLDLTNRLKTHVQTLASDSLEGREACLPGQIKAAKYISQYFDSLGLTPYNADSQKYDQDFYLTEMPMKYMVISSNSDPKKTIWSFVVDNKDYYAQYPSHLLLYNGQQDLDSNNMYLILEKRESKSFIDSDVFEQVREIRSKNAGINKFLISLPYKVIKPFNIESSHYSSSLLLNNTHIKSFFKHDYDFTDSVSNKNTLFLQKFLKNNPGISLVFSNCNSVSKLYDKKEWKMVRAHVIGSGERADIGYSRSAKENYKPFERIYHKTSNVVGKIEGTTLKDEVIIICAHYDHLGFENITKEGMIKKQIYYGADDNASGTSAVMEIARLFSDSLKQGKRPQRTIYFVAFSAEEKGLYGSEYFARNIGIPMQNIKAVLNMDMIGRTNKRFNDTLDYCFSLCKGRKKEFKKIIRNESKPLSINTRKHFTIWDWLLFYYGSDHYSFVKRNVPAIVFSTDSHIDYHKPTDTWEKINFHRMALITRLVAGVAWELGNK